ncbi:hypothetical protein ZYGR_0N02920 [Zygosaccharomyces rouxii]|uniref:ZYRO0D07040p n=2 Tax=Zygosaccharomyces rouxii TaxID=4956 RepID=C5DVI7_ZYGRC|nr:uncharacterized protein ZYRO0D07040g [Zygosaccharomyces rouxii]KAH9200718.1 hypothetical protein LQ764DRAFT_209093 [Zygosaccharomyces rouxii]GAV48887.1 hypothetical protein ZYGR_0N02920 [Zygosaccharomyces rouxii]CAR27806.1 ZYRO0D07040p [Zygosaccharomyces rouxii]
MKVGVLFHDLGNLDTDSLVNLFAQLLGNLELDAKSQLKIILTDTFRLSYNLDTALGRLYSSSRDYLISKDLYRTSIDVLIEQFSVNDLQLDWLFVPEETYGNRFTHKNLRVFQQPKSSPWHDLLTEGPSDFEKYKVSALGGTFDHIHDGHKILLTMAAFITSSRLIVGVTDQDLLVNKKYREFLETVDERCDNVKKFLALLKPTLKVEIVLIKDVCGPTGTVPEIEALVVSRETVQGGQFVNKTRIEKGLTELDISVVNVLGGNEEDGWKEKLSSTELRKKDMEQQ